MRAGAQTVEPFSAAFSGRKQAADSQASAHMGWCCHRWQLLATMPQCHASQDVFCGSICGWLGRGKLLADRESERERNKERAAPLGALLLHSTEIRATDIGLGDAVPSVSLATMGPLPLTGLSAALSSP